LLPLFWLEPFPRREPSLLVFDAATDLSENAAFEHDVPATPASSKHTFGLLAEEPPRVSQNVDVQRMGHCRILRCRVMMGGCAMMLLWARA